MNNIIRMHHAMQEPDDQPGTLHTEPVYYWLVFRRSARARGGRKVITDPTATEAEMAAMKAKYNWNDAEYIIDRGMCYNPDVTSDTLEASLTDAGFGSAGPM